MKKIFCLLVLLNCAFGLYAQEALVYMEPPKEILELADYERSPSVSMDSKKQKMVFMYRSTYCTLAELMEEDIKLAGLIINPRVNIESTTNYFNNLKCKNLLDKEIRQVQGLPANPRITNIQWSPDETKLAFTHTADDRVELWCMDYASGRAARVTDLPLNANLGSPYSWIPDGSGFLISVMPADRGKLTDTGSSVPSGPVVSVSSEGVMAQNRTYQNLLQSKADEDNFDILATSLLYRVDLSGNSALWKDRAIYSRTVYSPDSNYVLVVTMHKPYSYMVQCDRFPSVTAVYDKEGNLVKVIDEKPLIEAMPKGFMATIEGKRYISWRSDKPATLCWVEALDGGDPSNEAEYRDELFELPAPFSSAPRSMAKTVNRFRGVRWGNDTHAVISDVWQPTRNTKTYVFNPSDASKPPVVLFDRNSQDIYSDPGQFDMVRNRFGMDVLNLDGNRAYLVADGYSEDGKFPFVDEIDLVTKKKKRLFQSQYTDKLLDISAVLDVKKGDYLVRLQSPTEFPNYYVLNARKQFAPTAVTAFENPFRSIDGVYKEVIKYNRPDGVELSGTLYLPAGYDREKKEKLPMIMWAYPTEYKDKSSAGQSKANPNSFTGLSYGTPVYWVTRGYAVLNDAAFPIVGEGGEEPNDTFIEQLVANAKAAIDAVDAMGYIDRNRVAVGGHSYGAFMTANLLTHSDLFAAGIARSGAYNRTLTPFGFQSEERNYWEAPDVYNSMSPFMHADKMKHPLLLVHGGQDDNPGTFTIQSERYFNALKGFGAPARLVVLPGESHGYSARESVMHLLWEQDQWLEKYVKNRK